MKLTVLLASSAALAAIAVAVPTAIVPSWNPVATAQAATSVSFSLFYDGLDDYGDWVSYDGDYVFVPVIDDHDWQPYTEGHWVYLRGYGWTWVSDEPFGWATYHYGRWGFDDDIGWYWVPGRRWAPAWVSWRRSGSHVAWAPLPPHRGDEDDISISVNIGSIPDYYWVAVPSQSFLEVNINVVIVDDRERRRFLGESEFVGNVQVENNIVVNNVIDINYVEENTGKKVKEIEAKQIDDPAKAKSSDGQVEVFNGTVEPDKNAKPPKLKEVTEVEKNQAEPKKKVKAESGEPPAVAPDEQAAQPGEEQPDTKKIVTEQPEGQATGTDVQAEKPADKKKKLKVDQTEGAATGSIDQAATPADIKKKKKVEESEASVPGDESADPAVQPVQKKASKKKAKAEETVDGASQPQESQPDENQAASDEQPAQKGKKKAQPVAPCDPATQEGCAEQ
jgi:hypothetical protein